MANSTETFEEKQARELREFQEHQARVKAERERLEAAHLEQQRKDNEFTQEVIQNLMLDYQITRASAEKICAAAWDYGHAYGYNDVQHYANELGELVEAVLDIEKKFKS